MGKQLRADPLARHLRLVEPQEHLRLPGEWDAPAFMQGVTLGIYIAVAIFAAAFCTGLWVQ